VVPVPEVWYRFRIQVQDRGDRTEIRANVWPEGQAEPQGWQIACDDTHPDRPRAGTVGIWSLNVGAKYWDDLTVGPLP